jgi:hypothetical protein
MKPNTDGKAIEVDLVAPGCGFERGNTIAATDRGSSFASPYVAVMAWIKAMADGVSPKAMKQVLRRATRPAPYEDRMVSTRGVFDPAMLFLPITQEPHMLLSDNTIVPLSKATLTLKYAAVDAGSSSENARTDTIPLGPQYTGGHVAVFRCSTPNEADRYCLWRKDLPGFDPVIWRAYSVRIERKDQDPLDYTAAEFAAKVKDLCF